VSLAIDDRGRGEPLALVHGLGTTRDVWRRVVPALAERRRVLAVDVPGFGESAPPASGFDLDEVADTVADGLAARVGGEADLVGHSLGGVIVARLARRHPRSVRRLVLCAPAGLDRRPRVLIEVAATGGPAFLMLRRAIGRPLAGIPAARRLLLWGALDDASTLEPAAAVAMLDASRGAHRLGEATHAALSADLASELAEVRSPLGLLWGERDRLVRVGRAQAILETRPEAPLETVAEAGHVAHIERPAGFVSALERLLVRLSEPAERGTAGAD
jgi:pimeloyl-ACP methyl ester carboxylesterase